jgi:hypothetical protein
MGPMFIKRIITLVVLLSVALGAGNAVAGEQQFAGPAQTVLTAAPSSGDCNACKDCAKPCPTVVACNASCVSVGAAFVIRISTMQPSQGKLAASPDLQLSSVELRTPTPPPKLSQIA